MLGVHFGPVRSEVAEEELRKTLFFSRTMSFTASATEDAPPSTTTSTPSRSNHWRVTLEPTSGLFWLSAKTTSTLKPRLPNSAAAWRTQASSVGPVTSR